MNRAELTGWKAPRFPDMLSLEGRYCRLELLSADTHAAALYRANSVSDDIWDFLPYGPFSSAASYHRWMREATADADPRFYAIWNKDHHAWEGVASFLRIRPQTGSIEVGHVNLSPALQKTRAATETIFLMMQWAFEAGYRRFEWKCDAGNQVSRRAAERLGLSYEGVFRQHLIVKGRNRDTAWFAAVDGEWPALKEAFSVWLAPGNFNSDDRQIETLSDLTRLIRVTRDPSLR